MVPRVVKGCFLPRNCTNCIVQLVQFGTASGSRSSPAGRTQLSEDFEEFAAGNPLTALNLSHALGEALVQSRLLFFGPGLVRFEEVERAVDDLGGFAVGTAFDLTLDALFELGIEGEGHGGSIPLLQARLTLGMVLSD